MSDEGLVSSNYDYRRKIMNILRGLSTDLAIEKSELFSHLVRSPKFIEEANGEIIRAKRLLNLSDPALFRKIRAGDTLALLKLLENYALFITQPVHTPSDFIRYKDRLAEEDAFVDLQAKLEKLANKMKVIREGYERIDSIYTRITELIDSMENFAKAKKLDEFLKGLDEFLIKYFLEHE